MTALPGDPQEDQRNRRATFVLLSVVFINLMGFGILLPILPFYGQSFHAPAWQVTLVFTSFSIGNFIAEPVWGRLSDRIGRRPILLGTIFASGLGFVALAFAPNIWVACLIRLVSGLTTGNLSTIQSYIADVTPPQNRAGRMGMLGAAFALGFMAGPALGGLLARPSLGPAGFHLPLYLAGALSFAASAGVLLFVRESRSRVEADAPAALKMQIFRDASRCPIVSRALIVTLLLTSAFAAAESTFGLWAQHRFGWGPRQLSLCFAIVAITAALAQGFVTGRLTRRYGEAIMLASGLAIIALTLAAQPFGQGVTRTVVLLALTVFGQALALPNITALISRATPADRQGSVLGLNMSLGALARAAGPAAGGALFSIVGVNAPLFAAALLLAPAVLLAVQANGAAKRQYARG
jgi:DHA1 family tetracycline resistance protein-like MFS transporter